MLIDLTLRAKPDPITTILTLTNRNTPRGIVHLDTGLYLLDHWNPEYLFKEKLLHLDEYDFSGDLKSFIKSYQIKLKEMRRLYSQRYKRNWPKETSPYGPTNGVVDYPLQVLEIFPHFKDDENDKYVIFFVEIKREDQPSIDGWRYHKWGEYYGKQRPLNEYLYDDKHIDVVYTFKIRRIE